MSEITQDKSIHGGSPERSAPTVRSRVSQACEVCRKRKVKCNGQEPCSYCVSSGKICSFKEVTDNAALSRQHANSVDVRLAKVEDTLRKVLPMAQAFETWAKANGVPPAPPSTSPADFEVGPSTHPPSEPHQIGPSKPRKPYKPSSAIQKLSLSPNTGISPQPMSSPRSSEIAEDEGDERWSHRSSHLTKDSYGNLRYTGGTSSFMLVDALTTLQQEPTTDASPESTFSGKGSAADLQLPFFSRDKQFRAQAALPRPEDIDYPPDDVADELVATYFSEIHHTFPILHQQLFLERYKKIMEAQDNGKPTKDHAFLASVFAVFACGACLANRKRPKGAGDGQMQQEFRGIEFYEKAQLLFWIGSGSSQIEHVQCLALLAICNASWNTLAQSWINAGQAIRRAQDLGLHRITRQPPLSPLEKEIRRRVWWCVYGLDRVLSIALGRPSGTHDDDCDIEMPTELDDAQLLLSFEGNTVEQENGTSYMTGFVALLKIYIIAGRIVRFAHSPRLDDPKSEQARQILASLDADLAAWINNLPPSIRFAANDNNNPRMLALCLITFFVYYSAIINLHRPFIPDYPSTAHDFLSLGHCLGAARACIRIGEITQEMLPTSHHLAFAVQYITLSGVLLLRCLAYVNQPTLVSAILSDAEKCIKILGGMEDIWPASKRCRDIVSDLLVVLKTKMYGGPSAIEELQAAQRKRDAGASSTPVNDDSSSGKRKRSTEQFEEGSSRQRLENGYSWQNGGSHGNGPDPRYSTTIVSPTISHSYPESFLPGGLSHQQRLSNLRTSMDRGEGQPSSPQFPHPAVRLPTEHPPNGSMGPPPSPLNQMHRPGQHLYQSNFATPPSISLDPNTWGRDIEGLPFNGYDFLGDDLLALLGNVIRPSPEGHKNSQAFEENAQYLLRAYNGTGQYNAPFGGVGGGGGSLQ